MGGSDEKELELVEVAALHVPVEPELLADEILQLDGGFDAVLEGVVPLIIKDGQVFLVAVDGANEIQVAIHFGDELGPPCHLVPQIIIIVGFFIGQLGVLRQVRLEILSDLVDLAERVLIDLVVLLDLLKFGEQFLVLPRVRWLGQKDVMDVHRYISSRERKVL